MLVIGIDPGLDGGIAILVNNIISEAIIMPTKIGIRGKREIDSASIFTILNQVPVNNLYCNIDLVIVEQVHSMPKSGVVASFSFGKSVGKMLGVLEVLKLKVEEITPQAWKKEILSGTDKSKAAAIGYVQSRFPEVNLLATLKCKKPHDGMADAICLAEYGRRFLICSD